MTAAARERLDELLADQALGELSTEEGLELETLLAAEGREEDLCMAKCAALLELACLNAAEVHPMPRGAHRRLCRAGKAWGAATAVIMGRCAVRRSSDYTRIAVKTLPWVAVAACMVLVTVAWWPTAAEADVVQEVRRAPDKATFQWCDWEKPEIVGVAGEAVWCDKKQRGYARFKNLPRNDPAVQEYQLWIIDDRGMDQRISGAVFDSDGSGEVIVPIQPGIRIKGVRAFAVTIEEPGGASVSKLDRKVVIASK